MLTVGQAASRIGIHPNTLRSYAAAGLIAFLRLPGGHRRFAVADVETFIDRLRGVPDREPSAKELDVRDKGF